MSLEDIRVERDDLSREPVQALLREHLTEMEATSPAESVHALSLDGLRAHGVTFWTAWAGRRTLLGCCALRHLDDTHGEIKSMRTSKAARMRGVASRLLSHVMVEGERRRYERLSLETGSQDHFAPARQFYARNGFIPCPPFADYGLDPNSVFMTRNLNT